jgi:hypothetical protein
VRKSGGSSRYADQVEAGKRVDAPEEESLGAIVKKGDRKWYPVAEGADSRGQAA